ncbi:MAG: translation initiation factor IF-2, partial [Bacteroidales bacterium]|nr:translation initiation factor IF-2 [Bacteroidales bacterium]
MVIGKATRLSKAAREFNVGISTIVEFLQKKGFDIDSNPNTKVSPEQYDLLVKEYSSDFDVKKESEKLSLNQLHTKKEAVSINDVHKEEEIEEEIAEDETLLGDEEILIKDVSGSAKFVTSKSELKISDDKKESDSEITEEYVDEDETVISDTEKAEDKKKSDPVKVVGKIDLDSLNQKTRPDKKTRK